MYARAYQHHATIVEASVLSTEIRDLLPESDTTEPTADAGSDQIISEGTGFTFDGVRVFRQLGHYKLFLDVSRYNAPNAARCPADLHR
jgi:hypothetical protein